MIIKTDDAATYYYNDNKQRHRATSPAIVWSGGAWSWWLHGYPHRYYGPADNNGYWWLQGARLRIDDKTIKRT